MIHAAPITITAAVFSIIFMCGVICNGRTYPLNYALLLGFTVAESYLVAAVTAKYPPKAVIMAGLATAMATVACTIYAWRTKESIETHIAVLWIICLAMIPVSIIGVCMGLPGMHTVVCCFGILFYGMYLIIDT